jgi:hypothetical protein
MEVLHLENVNFSANKIKGLIRSFKSMPNLKTLVLDNVTGLVDMMSTFSSEILNLKQLEKLSLKNNGLQDYGFLSRMVTKLQTLVEIDIYTNRVGNSDLMAIWMVLFMSDSIREFTFSKHACFFSIETIIAVEAETKMNCLIADMDFRSRTKDDLLFLKQF